MTDAIVNKDGYNVPLIGVPADAVQETCDLCHDTIPMREAVVTGTGVMCKTCCCNSCTHEPAAVENNDGLLDHVRCRFCGIIMLP